MDSSRQLEELCAIVAELAQHVRKIALGMQGLNIDEQLGELVHRVEEIKTNVKS